MSRAFRCENETKAATFDYNQTCARDRKDNRNQMQKQTESANVKRLCQIFEDHSDNKKPIRQPRNAKLASSRPLPKAASKLSSNVKFQELTTKIIVNEKPVIRTKPDLVKKTNASNIKEEKGILFDKRTNVFTKNIVDNNVKDITSNCFPLEQKPNRNVLKPCEKKVQQIDKFKSSEQQNSSSQHTHAKPVPKEMRSLSPAMKRRDAFRRTDKPDLFPNGEQVPKVKRSPPSNVSSPILSSEDDKSPSDETRTVNETKKMFESPNQENLAPKAPSKPPRTFAHDIYVKQKAAIKKPPIPDFESHLSPNSSLRSGELRRRSRSLEHIYAEPLPVTATSNRKQRASLEVEPYCVTPLFSTPVSTPSKPCTVREIIKNSFGVLRKLTRQKSSDDIDTRTESSDSGSEASLKDLKERLIYVQTIKKSFSRSATHYYSTDQMKSPALCRCCLILDDDDEKRQTVPYNVEVVNFEAVSHLITSGREIDTKFYWFTMYTKGDLFLYAYCFRQKNEKRTICLLSDVFFPELFHRIFNTFFTQTEIKVELIDYLRSKSCALPGEMLTFNNQTVLIPFDCQITITTPSILLNFFSAETLIKAVSTLVHERRVILVSKSIQTLFISSQSLISLIYPFAWDYVYMPLIPSEMLEFYASLNGIPYVIGLKSSDLHPFLRKARRRESKILVIDLDNGSVVTEVGDESEIIPYKIQRAVINALNLSRNMTDPKENYRDLVVREAFIQMFIELIGTARCYIANGEFKTQYFINSIRSKNIQMFAHWFCETRLFEAFIKYCHLRHIQSQIQPLFNKQRRMGTFERETQMACKAICVDLFKVKTDEKGTEKKIWPLRNINIFQTHS